MYVGIHFSLDINAAYYCIINLFLFCYIVCIHDTWLPQHNIVCLQVTMTSSNVDLDSLYISPGIAGEICNIHLSSLSYELELSLHCYNHLT